ncbi:MAG: transcription termination/antitermination NusG family protein, partial [Acidobacteriota bacterium]|nr:transcription termination/antitermination NusG family protein [Acidobacteriota bacterium]
MDWFIVHTYSGFEDRVVLELTNRIKALGMETHFGEIRVPKETVVEMKAGKRR